MKCIFNKDKWTVKICAGCPKLDCKEKENNKIDKK